jgi:hypothetical protein
MTSTLHLPSRFSQQQLLCLQRGSAQSTSNCLVQWIAQFSLIEQLLPALYHNLEDPGHKGYQAQRFSEEDLIPQLW